MPNLSSQEKSAITKFKGKAREFWSVWESLNEKKLSSVANMPQFKNEYETLMNRGATIRGNIEFLTGTIDKASDAYDSVKNWLNDTFGLIPLLIPVTGLVVSVGVMGKWVKDAYTLNKKMTGVQTLINQGVSPEQAWKIVKDGLDSPLFSIKGLPIPLLILGVGAYFLYTRK